MTIGLVLYSEGINANLIALTTSIMKNLDIMLFANFLVLLSSFLVVPTFAAVLERRDDKSTIVANIRRAMLAFQRAAWEQGVASMALIELDYPNYSEFSSSNPFRVFDAEPPMDVIVLAHDSVTRQLPDGRLSLAIGQTDPVALDPASNGPAVLIAAKYSSNSGFYSKAVSAQLNYILNTAPRAPDGTISHRADRVQLWSDGVYMGPPFLAYLGAQQNNFTLLNESFTQIANYRKYLFDTSSSTWRHIYDFAQPNISDSGHWATGNGWVLAGMNRVLASITQSIHSNTMLKQKQDLKSWIKETIDGVLKYQDSKSGLFYNYLDNPSTFLDAASTAAFSYSIYRACSLDKSTFGSDYVTKANNLRDAVMNRIDSYGFVNPVVNAQSYSNSGIASTEAQAFALLMIAAERDLKADNTTVFTNSGQGGVSNNSTSQKSNMTGLKTTVGAAALGSILVSNYYRND